VCRENFEDATSVWADPVAAPLPPFFFGSMASLLVFELLVQFMQFAA
jgi:hypothetical protein